MENSPNVEIWLDVKKMLFQLVPYMERKIDSTNNKNAIWKLKKKCKSCMAALLMHQMLVL
jgi:hypothetical protein